jgi:rhomboid protease GluP
MTCQHCGQSNFNWARCCDTCRRPLTAGGPPGADPVEHRAGTAPAPSSDREVRLALPEPVDHAAEDARAVREAFAHTDAPFVTPLLIAANVVMFVVVTIYGNAILSPSPELLRRFGAAYGPLVTSGEWWRLGAATFLHFGLIHLAFNLFVLASVGALTERMFGHVSFLLLYLLAGVGGSVASVWVHPFSVGAGASGAIFGLYGALFAYLAWKRTSLPRDVVESLRNGAVAFVVYNILVGATRPGVDIAAHAGGLAAGALVGLALASPLASASPVMRSATRCAVSIAGAAALTVLAWQMPKVDDWPEALQTLALLDTRGQIDVDNAIQAVANDTLSAADAAARIEQRVLAPWRAQRERLVVMTRLPIRERRLAATAVTFMDHRIAAWRLHAEAFRSNDLTLLEKSASEQAAANAAAGELVNTIGLSQAAVRRASAHPRTDDGGSELERALQVVQQLHHAATVLYNNALARVQAHALTDAQLATLVEEQILPSWNAQWRRIGELHASGEAERSRRRIEDYMRLSSESWRLTAVALRTHSHDTLTRANALRVRAVAAASSIHINEPSRHSTD